jgi:small-conductance mechanosensitive channel
MDVKKHQEKSTHRRKSPSNNQEEKKGKVWVGSYIILGLAFLAFHFLLQFRVFEIFGKYRDTLVKFSMAAFIGVLILAASKVLEIIIRKEAHTKSGKYNLIRLLRIVTVLAIAAVIISFLFQNWYAAAVSLGLISLILGFALQTPISSFIGWIYIIIRNPYRIGDRIQVADFKGDVVEIGYLDTTLWEFSGEYLTNDLPSGRLIRFPNTLVFQSAVFNYSWQKFPYIWNEIPFHVAYESDLEYVSATIKKVATKILGEDTAEAVRYYKELLKNTPIDELEIKEYPFVNFRTNANTWLEASLTYLVPPKRASIIRTRLLEEIVTALLKEPDRVMFPKSNAR